MGDFNVDIVPGEEFAVNSGEVDVLGLYEQMCRSIKIDFHLVVCARVLRGGEESAGVFVVDFDQFVLVVVVVAVVGHEPNCDSGVVPGSRACEVKIVSILFFHVAFVV